MPLVAASSSPTRWWWWYSNFFVYAWLPKAFCVCGTFLCLDAETPSSFCLWWCWSPLLYPYRKGPTLLQLMASSKACCYVLYNVPTFFFLEYLFQFWAVLPSDKNADFWKLTKRRIRYFIIMYVHWNPSKWKVLKQQLWPKAEFMNKNCLDKPCNCIGNFTNCNS